MIDLPPFHLALPVANLRVSEEFAARRVLGCQTGRRDDKWLDFNFHGHQIVAHLTKLPDPLKTNLVNTKQISVPQFGVIIE